MKKSFRKVSALVLSFLMVLAMVPAMGKAQSVKADEKTYKAFIGIGAGSTADGWDLSYSGPDNGALEGATVEEAELKVGEEATISITFPQKALKIWWMAPCIIVDEAGLSVDVTVKSLKIDGEEIAIDASKYDQKTWYEGTGDAYPADKCIRTYGGYNEWGVKDGIVLPAEATKVEYTIKLNSVIPGDSYLAFVALQGDKTAGDWGFSYIGPAGDNTEGVTGVAAPVKVGESVTVSATFPENVVYTWWTAPCVLIPDATDKTVVDATVTSVKVDGKDVAFDLTKDTKSAWAEVSGNYGKGCFRIAGGYNEWGAQFIESPQNFKTIEYTFTLNKVDLDPVEKEVVDYTGALDLHIAFGGDKDADGDWGYGYTAGFSADPVPEEETIKVGETKTVSLTFSKNVPHAYYFAPYLSSDIEAITDLVVDIDITCKINGVEVAIDGTDKKVCWNENTGDFDADHAVRLMGGHNDWADTATFVTIPEEGIKTLEYTITLKSAKIEREVQQEFDKTLLDKTYNGYLIFQCPDTWVYRDDWTNETSGLLGYKDGVSDNFTHVTWNEGPTDADKNLGGTILDAVIDGNGKYTVKIEGFKAGLADSTAYNMLYASLDIPYDCIERGGVEIKDAVLLIDGKKQSIEAIITKGDKVESKNHPEVNGTYTGIQFINTYNASNPNAKDSANIPQKSMEIQFTISGLAKDSPTGGNMSAGETVEPTKAPAEPTAAPAEPTKAPTAAPEKDNAGASNNTPIIIVVVVCAVVLVAAVVAIVVVKKKKK